MNDSRALLKEAESIAAILGQQGIEALVIGAVALAAHHYVRQTEDLDFAVNADLSALNHIATSLRQAGYTVQLHEPDAEDPLAGVLDVTGSFGSIQIISYADRFPAVIEDALRETRLVVSEGSLLRIAPIPHLVALKLYAGGFKSKADIVELLNHNPGVNLEEIREVCDRYRLSGLDELIRERGPAPD